MSGAIDNTEIGKIKQELNTSIEEYNPEKNSGTSYDNFYFLYTYLFELVKPFQNKKGQKNLRYPTKKQSFSL